MSLTAANPGGWSLNEVLTSAQMTHLQNELLKAIDGVNGGTYTLASPLQFAGADVRIAADLEVINGGEINIQNGGALNVLAGGIIDFSGDLHISSGGELVVENGGLITMQNGSDMFVDGTAVVAVEGTIALDGGSLTLANNSQLDLGTSSDLNLGSACTLNLTSATMTVNSGAQVLLQGGGLLIQSTGFIQSNGGDITLHSSGNGRLISQANCGIDVEDAEDLTINDSPEQFRTMLVPFGFQPGWEPRITSEVLYEQTDVSSAKRIVFPLAIRPGDDLINVFVGLNAENGHVGLPGTMPRCRIVRAALDGTFTVLATLTDDSPDVATYEAPHYVILENGNLDSGTMPILATLDPLYLMLEGETGANSITGLEVGSLTGNVTARSYRTDAGIYS